ncbi:MAG: threonylcarbamoyl-AMP synthase [Bacteroides sp.]|nr:threonylcarbamoyl-AMP synthase [Bacteroides sp.]
MRYDADDLARAVEALRCGGVIIYPTDTVWGIGCDATNEEAVARVKSIKGRDDAKALITLVSDTAMLERWVDDVPEVALELVEASEGSRPVTVVYDKPSGNIARGLLAPDGSAGFRVCSDPFAAALCRRLRRPIVSTSANFSGEPTPASFGAISTDFLSRADYVARFRRDDNTVSKPSSVIKISAGGVFKIIRP